MDLSRFSPEKPVDKEHLQVAKKALAAATTGKHAFVTCQNGDLMSAVRGAFLQEMFEKGFGAASDWMVETVEHESYDCILAWSHRKTGGSASFGYTNRKISSTMPAEVIFDEV